MSVLTYGGIALSVLKTHHIGSEDVYDDTGLDYLWTRYTFDVTGLVNIANTSFGTRVGNPVPVSGGTVPFLTIANIRDTFSLPRQPLTYVDELGNVMVTSPALAPVLANLFVAGAGNAVNLVQPPKQLDCDCDGQGPKPLRPVEILGVHGAGKSVIVRFAISTTINDSIFWTGQGGIKSLKSGGGGFTAPKPPIILSNRWSTSESLDEAAFSTRTYTGRAVFRADLLRDCTILPTNGTPERIAVPDDFRSYWGNFLIPPGFQRRQVFVEQDPSAFAVNYRVVDVQLPVTLTDQRACKLEVIQTLGMSSRGAEQAAGDLASAYFDLAIWAASNASIDPVKDAGTVVAAGLKAAKTGAELALSHLPKSYDQYVITATGQPGSSRGGANGLVGLLYKAFAVFLTAADSFFSSTDATLSLDLMGKWARLTVSIQRGPLNSAITKGQGAGVVGACTDFRGRIPDTDGIAGVTTPAPGTQPPYPSDSGTRGTPLEWLVAQSLMLPYNEAPPPQGHSQAGQGLIPP